MTNPPAPPPIIVWFRDDLRLSDHPALHAAAKAGAPVIGLFVLDEASPGLRPLGGATRWWLAQSLRALEASLKAKGASLVLRQGPAAKVVADVAREAGAAAVFWNEIAHEPHLTIAKQLETALAKLGVDSKTFPGDLLVSPNDIRNKDGRGLRVFTPFWRRVLALGDPPTPLPAPKSLRPAEAIKSDLLESLGLEPHHPA
jgi:deoxyribodipyrimidine photo-lyase